METEILITISDYLKRDMATRMIVNYWIRNSTLIHRRHFLFLSGAMMGTCSSVNIVPLVTHNEVHNTSPPASALHPHSPQSLNVLSKQNPVVIMKKLFQRKTRKRG